MPNQQQLSQYIQQQRSEGVVDQAIQQNLMAGGWSAADIAVALSNDQVPIFESAVTSTATNISSLNKLVTILMGVAGVLLVLGGGAYYFISYPVSPLISSTTGSILQCPGIKIPMPEKWTELPPAVSNKLDADGCLKNSNGCLCVKKDSDQLSSKNVVFSTLVEYYPEGLTLDGVVTNAGSVSDVKKFDFLGYPAVQFVAAGTNQKIITTAFLKDKKLYKFDFGASADTFIVLWPDIETALQGMRFQ